MTEVSGYVHNILNDKQVDSLLQPIGLNETITLYDIPFKIEDVEYTHHPNDVEKFVFTLERPLNLNPNLLVANKFMLGNPIL